VFSVLTATAVSTDSLYDSFDAADVTVTNVDDDAPLLDVDANQTADAATDGILIIRYLFGFRGAALTDGAIGGSAANSDSESIEAALGESSAMLDVDGNGTRDAATDGILVIRYLFGFLGNSLVAGAIGSNAVRTTGEEIKLFLDRYLPGSVSVASSGTGTGTGTSRILRSPAVTDGPNDGLVAPTQQSPMASTVTSTPFANTSLGTALWWKNENDLFDEVDTEIRQRVLVSSRDDDPLQLDQTFENTVDWLSMI